MKIKSFTEFSTPVVKEDETITKKIVYRNEDDKDDEAVPFEKFTEEDGAEEIQMAMGELERIGDYADMIMDKIKVMPDLEAWVQSKITKAKDYVTTVHDYLDGVDGVKEAVNEATNIYEDGKVSITRFAAGGGKRDYQITKSGSFIILTAEELRALLSNAKNLIGTVKESVNESQFKVGDTVIVTRTDGKEYTGKVEKLNPLKLRTSPSDTMVIPNAYIKDIVVNESVNETEDLNESTRWQVGTIDKNGNIESAYVHYDGYPENVKPLLTKHYTDKKKIADLMKLAKVAGVSYLAPELGAGKQNFNDPDNNTSLFYGRDRGEKGKSSATLRGVTSSIEDYIKNASNRSSADYVYLYDQRDGKWYYASYKDKTLKTL